MAEADPASTTSSHQAGRATGQTWGATWLGEGPEAVARIALVVANLAPIAGVLLLDWSVPELLLLYWLESAALGTYTFLTLLHGGLAGILMAVFFVFHAGNFMLAHLAFIVVFIVGGAGPFAGTGGGLDVLTVLTASMLFFVLHGLAYRRMRKEVRSHPPTGSDATASATQPWTVPRATTHPTQAPPQPIQVPASWNATGRTVGAFYARIVVMHAAVFAMVFGSLLVGSPWPAMVVLVLAKTALEVALHKRRLARREAASAFARAPGPTGA